MSIEGSKNQSVLKGGKELTSSLPPKRDWAHLLQTNGLIIALVFVCIFFSVVKTDAFFSVANAKSILTLAAPLTIAALGVTTALVLNEIDLSIGAMIGLGGAVAICLMSFWSVPWPIAVLLALAIAVVAGTATGIMVAHIGANSLIITLGMGTLLTGVEFLVTGQRTIFSNIDPTYVALGQSSFLGLNTQIWIATAVASIVWLILERTEMGRYMYAVGTNSNAAYLAGVPVKKLRIFGFVIAAILATAAGILLSAQASSSFPSMGMAYLLPAFAASFLGTTLSTNGRFSVKGTLVAVLFIGVIQTGLTMLQLSTGAINIAQGGLLVSAVLLSYIGKKTS